LTLLVLAYHDTFASGPLVNIKWRGNRTRLIRAWNHGQF